MCFLTTLTLRKSQLKRLLFKVYDDETLSGRTYNVWLKCFRNDDFDMKNKNVLDN